MDKKKLKEKFEVFVEWNKKNWKAGGKDRWKVIGLWVVVLSVLGALGEDRKTSESASTEQTKISGTTSQARKNDGKVKTCSLGFFGPSVEIRGGIATYDYDLPTYLGLDSLIHEISGKVYDIAHECEDANKLNLILRVSGLVDKYGNQASDEVQHMDVDLQEVKKFKHDYTYRQNDTVKISYATRLKFGKLSRFIKK